MSYAYNQQSQKQALIGNIMGLMKELQNLAPHPDCPGYKGPLFIQSNPNFKLSDERDGMLGSMIMEGMIGAAFSEAVSGMIEDATQQSFDLPAGVDFSNLADLYSEYITDVTASKERNEYIAAHGQGTLARMSGKSISKGFNLRASISENMQSFLDDLPKRMLIERNMAYYAKQLDFLNCEPANQHANQPANQYASAPGMAA
ncbi:MAG: hypothetical protein KAJ40_07970 [Alphaproteobacteria bacterium]|nr:hypothetical protein [Alphaproteobacteria bacterium]